MRPLSYLRYLKWGDWLLIVGVLAAALLAVPLLQRALLASASASILAPAPAKVALVRLEGELIERLPLGKDRRLVVKGPLGETEIEVRAGRVRVVRSPGPYKLCIKRGWISQSGEILICLPNRVTVEIPGEPKGYDALVW